MSKTAKPKGYAMFALLIVICIGLWTGEQSRQDDSIRSIESEISQSDSTLVEQVASAGQSLSSNHIADVNKMVDDPKPVPSPSDKPAAKEIIVFMGVNCPPCEKWKRCEMQRFQEAGWKVAICEPGNHNCPLTPTFSISADGKTVEKVGYIKLEEVAEVLK